MKRFVSDQSGATAIEYGLIVCLLSITILGGVTALRMSLLGLYTAVATAVAAAL